MQRFDVVEQAALTISNRMLSSALQLTTVYSSLHVQLPADRVTDL